MSHWSWYARREAQPWPRLSVGVLLGASMILALGGRAEGGWTNFNASAGLPGNSGHVICDDSRGCVWLATPSGLTRCDGTGFTVCSLGDGSPSNGVEGGVEDAGGNVWFWGGGAFRYDGTVFRRYTTQDGLGADAVQVIFEDRAGDLWFGTSGGGVTRYDGSAWTTYTTADGLPADDASCIFEDGAGRLWFATSAGVVRFDGAGWVAFTPEDGLGFAEPDKILEDGFGTMWFMGWMIGASAFDGTGWRTYPQEQFCDVGGVLSATIDHTGCLVVGSFGCVSRFDGERWQRDEGCLGWTRVFTDRDGGLWLLCDRETTTLRQGSRWFHYPTRCPTDWFEDRRGNVWISTGWDGVYRFDRAESAQHPSFGTSFQCFAEDHAGSIWVGSNYGASKFDGYSWVDYALGEDPDSRVVQAMIEDGSGNMWFGTHMGAYRLDGVHYTVDDGLASNDVRALAEDPTGAMWFGTPRGATRFDGANWRTFTTADGLPSDDIVRFLTGPEASLWVQAGRAVAEFDGATWHGIEALSPARVGEVEWAIRDRGARLWFGTGAGVWRYDGVDWSTHAAAPPGRQPIFADHLGHIWFSALDLDLAEYDGTSWRSFDDLDKQMSGIPGCVSAGLEDSNGRLWLSRQCGGIENLGWDGVWESVLDRVSPQTGIGNPPPRVSPNRTHRFEFDVLSESGARSVEFTYSLDGSPWSPWSAADEWLAEALPDGVHEFRLRARDWLGNVDSAGAVVTFEIDATPPAPILASPVYGQSVRDSVRIRGTATDSRFLEYRIEFRDLAAQEWILLARSMTSVANATLASWNTDLVPDDWYELRLTVTDGLGLAGATAIQVVVDNHEPWADVTSPTVVSAARGGHVFTMGGELHLYFPPHAFERDAEVRVARVESSLVPDSLAEGGRCISPGYTIEWGEHRLQKPATLDFSHAPPRDGRPALYLCVADAPWQRVGGTPDVAENRISSNVSAVGVYAVFDETGEAIPGGTLRDLSLTPRVFSPQTEAGVAIGFTLGRSTPVTVKVFNRAGRLVREIGSGLQLPAGSNLLRWDGKDAAGDWAPVGLYVVSVEGAGERQVTTVAIAR